MSEMETSLSHRLVAAVDDELFGYINPVVTSTAPAEKAVVAVLRELGNYFGDQISDPRSDWGRGWCEHRSSMSINLRRLADTIEGS